MENANVITTEFLNIHNSAYRANTKRELTYSLFITHLNKWLEADCPDSLFFDRNTTFPNAFPAFIGECLKATNSEPDHLADFDPFKTAMMEIDGEEPLFDSVAELNAALEAGIGNMHPTIRGYVAVAARHIELI